MNPVQRFFRRYIFSTIGILALFLVVNLLLVLTVLTAGYMSGTDNGLSVRSVSSHVTEQGGIWAADDTALSLLQEHDAWAMLLDESGSVVWEHGLPEELPRSYTSAQVASFSRWYLQDYPVKVWSREDGALMVVGFAPDTLVERCVFHGDSLPDDVPGGGHCGLCVQPAADGLPDASEHPPGWRRPCPPILRGIQDLSRGSYQPLDDARGNWRRSTRG